MDIIDISLRTLSTEARKSKKHGRVKEAAERGILQLRSLSDYLHDVGNAKSLSEELVASRASLLARVLELERDHEAQGSVVVVSRSSDESFASAMSSLDTSGIESTTSEASLLVSAVAETLRDEIRLAAELEKAQAANAQLASKLAAKNTADVVAEAREAELRAALEVLRSELVVLEAEVKERDMSESLRAAGDATSMSTVYASRVSSYVDDMARVRDELDGLLELKHTLLSHNAHLRSQLSDASARMEASESAARALRAQKHEAEVLIENLKAAAALADQRVAAAEEAAAAASAAMSDDASEASTATTRTVRLIAEHLNGVLRVHSSRVSAIATDQASLAAGREANVAHLNVLKRDIEALTALDADADAELGPEVVAMRAALRELEGSIVRADEQYADLEAELVQVRAEADAAEASRSELETALVGVRSTLDEAVDRAHTSHILLQASFSQSHLNATATQSMMDETVLSRAERYMERIDSALEIIEDVLPGSIAAKEAQLLEERRLANASVLSGNISRDKVAAAHARAREANEKLIKLASERDAALKSIRRGIDKLQGLVTVSDPFAGDSSDDGESSEEEIIRYMRMYVESRMELVLERHTHEMVKVVSASQARQITRLLRALDDAKAKSAALTTEIDEVKAEADVRVQRALQRLDTIRQA